MVEYYRAVAGVLLPHLRERPLTMHRFPDGVTALGWYQYECRGAPPWLQTIEIPYRGGAPRRFCVVDDLQSLLWVANLAAIELHTYLGRLPALDSPSFVVFDLDPGDPADLAQCCRVALLLREHLDGMRTWCKTSGSVGLHVYVPLNRPVTYGETKAFARDAARSLAAEYPELAVDRNLKELRRGKVLIDWLQNDPSRSTVAPYSLRAMPWPTVSTPVTWEEVEQTARDGRAERLTFTAAAVLRRVQEHGDLFRDVLDVEQAIP